MVIDLATHPEKLAVIKGELAENRLTTRLFDTKLFTKCLSGNFSLKTLDESRHGLPNMLLSGTSFNFAIWKSESNQTHVSGRTLSTSDLWEVSTHDEGFAATFTEKIGNRR